MARFKPVGKKRTKKMAPAKQGQDNMRSSCQVVAGSAGASSGATAGAASPVTAPADDTFVPLAGSLGTKTPSGISIPSATVATTAVSAAATSSVAGANMLDFATAACSAAQLLVSLCPRRVHPRPRNVQKDPFHLLLKQQPSHLPLPLLLSTLATLHPSLLMLLPLWCNPFVNYLALLLKLLKPQPSLLPPPLLLSMLVTLHPSLLMLLPLRCNPFIIHLALLLKLLRLSFGMFYINSCILICSILVFV
jgi:hypothetical protein